MSQQSPTAKADSDDSSPDAASKVDSKQIDPAGGGKTISDAHRDKLDARRFQWQVDWRLLGFTGAGIVILLTATVASYAYHSSKAASTFLSRADEAADENRYEEEVRWLSSYLLLYPEDRDKIIRAAVAADTAVESATRENYARRVNTARKRLGVALAYLGSPQEGDDPNAEIRLDLRKRLIERLLETGGYYYRDVERHVGLLDADQDDPQAHKWLAVALVGQVQEMLYQDRDAGAVEIDEDYYEWLANQPPGIVLREALKRNLNDLELASAFIGLLQSEPETFGISVAGESGDSGAFSRAVANLDDATREVLDNMLIGLQATDDSRAKILLYRYAALVGENDRASELIKESAATAAARLAAEDFSADKQNDEAGDDEQSRPQQGLRLSPEAEALVWDYQCVYYGAASIADQAALGNASPEDMALAGEWLKQLRDLGIDSVPVRPDSVKQVYLVSGLLAEALGDTDEAISHWREGLTVVNDDNLDLLGNVAWALAKQVASAETDAAKQIAIQQADEAIAKFDSVIQGKRDELMLMTSDQISMADRTAIADAITGASWKKRVAEATVVAGNDPTSQRDREIIRLLGGLTSDEIRMEPQIRIAGISLLTSAYQRQRAWDLAAATLTDAAELFPTNQALVQASGEAWTRAGNRLQAAKQWQRARLSNVPSVRVASLQAEFAYQLRLIPEQREIATLRSRVNQLNELLEKTGDTFAKERLELQKLEAQLPPEGVLAEEHLQSLNLAEKISTLADDNPEDTELQMYAAERLAAAGEPERAQKVIARVQADDKVQSATKVLLAARVAAAAGKHGESGKMLMDYIKTDPDSAIALAPYASEFAKRANDPELAEQALLTIPEQQRTPAIYFALYQIAKVQDREGETQAYLEALHRSEGYGTGSGNQVSPAFSLFIDASKLTEKLLTRGGVQRDEPDFTAARKLVNRLQALRPNWGNAVALSGWLAFARGNYDAAVQQLRRGINAGDRQLRTRQLLWQALLILGRDEEAEREIQLASLATQTDVDPYDEISIGISMRRGDYDKALAAAKQIADQNADDPFALLVYARFALSLRGRVDSGAGAASSLDPEQLLADAKAAIEKAKSLADNDREKSAVASAEISLAISEDDEEKLEAALADVSGSGLKEAERLMLEAKALVALDRIDEAIEKLKAANELSPDFKAQMTLVRLLRSRSRGSDALSILEQAFEQDPNNPRIRTELAAQLVSSGEEIDWDQIAKLLNDDRSVTEQNRLVYALLLASKGNHYQRQEAVRLLREMAGSPTEVGIGAARVQAALMFEMVSKLDELTESERNQVDKEQYLAEARRIFKQLATRDNAALVDMTRYVAFLTTAKEDGDMEEARSIIDRMKAMPDATLEVLKLEMMLAQQHGDGKALPSVVDQWAKDAAAGLSSGNSGGVETVAGEALMRAGFIDEGIAWYRRAYEANADTFANYIVALSMASKYQEAAEIAAERYEAKPAATTAVLLVEALLAMDPNQIPPRYAKILAEATEAYPDNASLHESIATWAMQKGDKDRAIALYLKVLRNDERRLRTLNNLAMIFAEMPGRELEGLPHINNAIKLAGEDAELLDTKGTVLLRAGKLNEAAAEFAKAIERGEEKNKPRYMFHLVQSLMELGDDKKAAEVWRKIDFEKLDLRGLTPSERDAVKKLHEQFNTTPKQAA